MDIRIISFTEKGIRLSQKVAEVLSEDNVELFTKCSVAKERKKLPMIQYVEESMVDWAGKQMAEKRHAFLEQFLEEYKQETAIQDLVPKSDF